MKSSQNNKSLLKFAVIVCCLAMLPFFLQTQIQSKNFEKVENKTDSAVSTEAMVSQLSPSDNGEQNIDSAIASKSPFILTPGNFESFVQKCFQGELCELSDDPWKMYQDFKAAGNPRATDSFISFLRSKLRDPALRDRYKSVLKQMIDDFYSPEEHQFQEAAYFNYLGDLKKSLALYLDLEKRAASDPSLRSAPPLNIANTLYDMGRYQKALPYYEAALKEHLAKKQVDVVRFIEERIATIKTHHGVDGPTKEITEG